MAGGARHNRRKTARLVGPFAGLVVALSSFAAGCAADSTPRPVLYAGQVQLLVIDEPEGLEPVGRVQVTGKRKISELVEEFAARTAHLGGKVGKIDAIHTTLDPETRTESRFSTCGRFPRLYTCYRGKDRTALSVTTTLSGRAFR